MIIARLRLATIGPRKRKETRGKSSLGRAAANQPRRV